MPIFGKKKSLKERARELLNEIDELSEEEQKSLWDELEKPEDDSKGETETEKQIDKAEKDIADKGADSQTEKDRIDESVGEQEKLDGNKDSQSAKDRVDESEGEKKYVEKEEYEKLLERIAALEAKASGDDNKLPKPKEVEDDELERKVSDFFKD